MNVDELWERLGLDSLAKTALKETIGADATLRAPSAGGPSLGPATPIPLKNDIRLSLTPPVSLPAGTPTELNDMSGAADLVVLGQLGEGGMGTVLQARQPALSRDVAVKIPRRRDSVSLAHSLVEEARLAGSLEHPGIVPVHAIAFDAQGSPGLVMRLVGGVSWATLLMVPESVLAGRLGRASPNRLEAHLNVFLQVCNAIAFAHSQGVLHRDLKPANVLIGELGEIYVADWGVARRKASAVGPMGLKGTPGYFAPEMCTGDDAQMDERTDVFLLGATLYEVIEGHPPYARAADLRAAIAAAWHSVIPPLPAETPSELEAVVLKAMAHDKDARFKSVIELRDAVATYLQHASSHRLAAAATTSLEQLKKVVATAAPRDHVAPLAFECRFGFMHALAEWPQNPEALEGLERTIEQGVRYEIATAHAEPARALLREMKKAPPELLAEIERLEAEDLSQVNRLQRVARVTQDFDPKIAIRQRAGLFIGLAAAVTLSTVGPRVVPVWGEFESAIGKWQLLWRIVPAMTAVVIGAFLGRRGLLGTRLNRRFVGFILLSLVGLAINRTVTAAAGFTESQTLVTDLVLLGTLGAAYTVTFHLGFLVQPICASIGVLLCFVFPGAERIVFSVTTVVGLLLVLVTWTRWRSELDDLNKHRSAPRKRS